MSLQRPTEFQVVSGIALSVVGALVGGVQGFCIGLGFSMFCYALGGFS